MTASHLRYLQRGTALTHLPPLLAELGTPLDAVLDGTGIAAADLVPDRFLPYAAVLTVLDRAAALSGREDLGILLGRRQSLTSLGPAGEVMRHSSTLGEALNDYALLQIWNCTGAAVYTYRTREEFAFGYGIYDPAGVGAIQIHDTVLAIGCLLLSILTEQRVEPVELWSMRPAPADPAPLRTLARCPVRYGQDQTCIFLPPSAAAVPLPDRDRGRHDAALAQIARRAASAPWGKVAMVRHALRSAFISGRTGMDDVAAHLHLHPRSLRRALAREGTSFTALRDEVRFTIARELLSLTPLLMRDIALALDFADTSAFTHAFRRWSGMSPTDWRRGNGKAAPGAAG